jgi:hypothetical protein
MNCIIHEKTNSVAYRKSKHVRQNIYIAAIQKIAFCKATTCMMKAWSFARPTLLENT